MLWPPLQLASLTSPTATCHANHIEYRKAKQKHARKLAAQGSSAGSSSLATPRQKEERLLSSSLIPSTLQKMLVEPPTTTSTTITTNTAPQATPCHGALGCPTGEACSSLPTAVLPSRPKVEGGWQRLVVGGDDGHHAEGGAVLMPRNT